MLLLLGGISLPAASLGIGAAAACRPGWYTPATVDRARLKSDRSELFHLLDSIGAALNGGQIIDFGLNEGQVNRWIAARAEFWPEAQVHGEGFSYPQAVLLDQNRVRIGALVACGGAQLVLSANARLELTPDHLLVRLESLRLGALPIPRERLLGPIRNLLRAQDIALGSVSAETIRLRNEWIWPNGKRRFRIRRLEVSKGGAEVSLEPVDEIP